MDDVSLGMAYDPPAVHTAMDITLRDSSMRFSNSVFFHKSVPSNQSPDSQPKIFSSSVAISLS